MFTTYPKIKETHKALFEIIKNEVPTPNDFLKKMLALWITDDSFNKRNKIIVQ